MPSAKRSRTRFATRCPSSVSSGRSNPKQRASDRYRVGLAELDVRIVDDARMILKVETGTGAPSGFRSGRRSSDRAPAPCPIVESVRRMPGFADVQIARPSGVYVLLLGDAVVWVGQTNGIHARIRGHISRGLKFDRVLFRELAREQLGRYEGAVLRALLPPGVKNAPTYLGGDNEILAELGLPQHADELTAAVAARASIWSRRKGAGRK